MPTHTLLLVDDSPAIRAQVRAVFAAQPFAVVVAANLAEGVAAIETRRPDIILAAVKKNVDGYAVAHFAANNPQLVRIPVLLLVPPGTVDRQRVADSGAHGFLKKPLRPSVVVARVREALGMPPTAAEPIAPATRAEHPVSAAQIAEIVGEAVSHAIEAYERARHAPAATSPAAHAAASVQAPPELNRLKHDMGLDDMGFVGRAVPAHDRPRVPALPAANLHRLQHEMGLDDLEFVDTGSTPSPPVAEKALATAMGVDAFLLGDAQEPRPEQSPESHNEDAVHWLADQLELPHGDPASRPQPAAQRHQHRGAAEPIRHAVKALREGMSQLSALVHHHQADAPGDGASPDSGTGAAKKKTE